MKLERPDHLMCCPYLILPTTDSDPLDAMLLEVLLVSSTCERRVLLVSATHEKRDFWHQPFTRGGTFGIVLAF